MSQHTRTDRYITFLAVLAVIALFGALAVMLRPGLVAALQPKDETVLGYPSQTVRARVVSIVEEGEVDLGGFMQRYQVVKIEILDGPSQGYWMEMEYGKRQYRPSDASLRVGDHILVTIETNQVNGETFAYFLDFVRTGPMLWLFAAFVAVSVLVSGWKGLRGLGGILFSLVIVVFYIIPQIMVGKNPVLVSIVGSFFFLSITLYLVYGWTLKTHAAVLGTLISLGLTGLLAAVSVQATRLTGFGDENAVFLAQAAPQTLDMQGLLLAGMLIGALGVLDDLVIGQSSAVFELRAANQSLGLRFLYKRAMNIGRDHVAATVNTLVLAYAGASLPMLLLFSLNSHNLGLLLGTSYIAEEIVRTLVGSIGLFLSVPLTTFIACVLALYRDRLGTVGRYLGPDNSWDSESVFHSH